MTYDEIRAYVAERGEAADERYLIEAIEENTSDDATRELIAYWFNCYEGISDE